MIHPHRQGGVHIHDVEDTELPSPPTFLPAHMLGESYVPPYPGLMMPEDQFDDSAQPDDELPTEGSAAVLQGSGGLESRVLIEPHGAEFTTQHACARPIGKIIESRFTGAWNSYKKVPLEDRDFWFSEFLLYFSWRDEHRREIRKVFDHVCSNALKNRLYDAKTANRRPPCIPEKVWAVLLLLWASEPHKKTCTTSKQNRASDCGGEGFPFHFGGSISHQKHRDRLRERLGREPTIAEGFMHTHSRLGPNGERFLSDRRSHSRHDAYVDRYEPSSSEGEMSAPIPPLSIQMQRWTEMVGGQKKGRVFGLAGLASQRCLPSLTYTPTDREQQLEAELEAVKAEIEAQRAETAAQLQAQTSINDAMKAQLETLTQFMMSMQHQQPQPSLSLRPPTADLPFPTTLVSPPYPLPSRQPYKGTSSSAHPPVNSSRSSPRDGDDDSDATE